MLPSFGKRPPSEFLRARRERFVEEYLRCGIGVVALHRAGYNTSRRNASHHASALLHNPAIAEMIKDHLPQRSAAEMGRVYGMLLSTLAEAERQYTRARELEQLPGLTPKDRLYVGHFTNERFRLMLEAAQLVAKAAGLLVNVRLKIEDNSGQTINLIRSVKIVRSMDPAKTEVHIVKDEPPCVGSATP